MKFFFFFLFSGLLSIAAFAPQTKTTALSGNVTSDSGDALAGASVRVLNGAETLRGATTDIEGKYQIELAPGTYEIEFSYTGYETQRITGVPVMEGQTNTLDIVLKGGAMLDEVVVIAYGISNKEVIKMSSDIVAVTGAPSKGKAARAYKAEPKAGKPIAAPLRSESPASDRMYMAKPAMKMEEEADRYGESVADDVARREGPPSPGIPGQPAPHAGLLTAGEWNDLHNWNKHWTDLLADGEIDAYQKQYRFFPKNRFSVLLQNEQDLPISDAVVQLTDSKGVVVWEARTDNMGRAELWNGLYGAPATGGLSVTAIVDDQKHPLGSAKSFAESLNRYKIQRECKHASNVDIVWTVDATGSMGDELEYLKTELLDVIGRVKSANPDLAVRMGSVFYRDKGDDYLVKTSALNYDIAKTVNYIRKQSAGGGGDYPEAVHSALEEAIYHQPWSREAVARICFLVLDASPHQEPEVIESLQKTIREAAKKGIRIVPVSASGIQKDTEFLMKFFGLATNGSYVFLTDHSGIGGKHLEPTTDEYKVELLNDLLVRLITEYASVPTCEGKSTIRFDDVQAQNSQQQENEQPLAPIQYYPNPTVAQFTLELPFDADKVTLYDAEGKAVRSLTQLAAGTHSIAVNDLPDGYYTLRIWKGNQVQSGKLVVVRA